MARIRHRITGCIVLIVCVLLGACSPVPAPSPTEMPAAPTMRPTALPTPRPSAPPPITAIPRPTAAPGALVLWAATTEEQLEPLRSLIADLSRSLGFDIQVIGKSADGMQADLRAAALAGLPLPDLLWGSQDDLGIVLQQGLLQPAADGLDEGAFIPAVIAGATLDGQRWGTPLAAQGALFLLYNRKLVAQPPQTSDALIVAARAQTSGGRYGLVAGWAEPRWLAAWLAGAGGSALGADGAPTLDTPQMLAALNLLKELRSSGPPPPSTYADGVRLFREGQAAFAIDGDWSLEGYRQYTDTLDLGIAPMPVLSSSGRVAAAPLSGIYLMYGASLSDVQLERARALGAALAQPAAQVRLGRDLGLLPALRAAATDPALRGNPSLAAAQIDGALGLPPTQALRCAWSAIGTLLPPVLLGEVQQQDAGRLMQERAVNCLAAP
jgi:arabinogalactan oligomer/maltooligosaccharide transport system substrate-binding protein